MTDLLAFADWTWVVGLVAVAGAAALHGWIGRRPAAAPAMEQLAARIRAGALRVLRRGSTALAATTLAGVAALALLAPEHRVTVPAAFAGGVAIPVLAAWLGVLASTRANVRSAAAAHQATPAAAVRLALSGGAVSGLAVAALAVVGLGALYWGLGSTAVASPDRDRFARAVAALALGVSVAATLSRVGGGILAKAADLAARRVGRGDPRRAETLADQVGDHVGDVAGHGSDLIESAVAAVAACVALAAAGGPASDLAPATALALLALATGLIASALGVAAGPLVARSASGALRSASAIASLLFVAATLVVARSLGVESAAGSTFAWWAPWGALATGRAAGLLVAWTTEYHTAARPLRRVAEAAREGPAAGLLIGVAAGLDSVAVPALLLAGSVFAATSLAGLYGLALAAVGLLATGGVTQTASAYGAITDNASAIGALAGLPRDARTAAESLGALGNTSAAVAKGVTSVGAALTGLALLGAFAVSSSATSVGSRAAGPAVIGGLLVGAMLPFLAASLALAGAVRASARVVRALTGDPTAPWDDGRWLDLFARAALRETVALGALAAGAPVLAAAVAGASGLVGMLLGAVVSGGLLALFLANAGGVWDNAARFIAGGAHGGRGSPAHEAAAVAETLGDPLKDSCAPALNSLVKLMGILALVLAPWLATL
jgi:K(+)-stimulated pyrophosphate-energized sodium pump